jgi:hypothetical protein
MLLLFTANCSELSLNLPIVSLLGKYIPTTSQIIIDHFSFPSSPFPWLHSLFNIKQILGTNPSGLSTFGELLDEEDRV